MKKEQIIRGVKEIMPYVIILIVVVLLRTFIITPIIVNGESMIPTLKEKQILILNKYDKKYNRGDIVVVNYFNGEKEERLIKRVMGLPGEKVEYNENKLYINDKKVEDRFAKDTENFELSYIDIDMKKIPEGYYFVIGDNRNNSIDSRIIGLVKKEDIKGTVTQSLIPFKRVK
ncbi:MAG: signal peptidase I [Bacilli bacterium]|nr:signal peptidase I [Bacilli bacterium]